MLLKDYVKLHKLKAKDFKDKLGISVASFYYYLSGEQVPNPVKIEEIKAFTNGEVTANDHHRAHMEWLNKNKHPAHKEKK